MGPRFFQSLLHQRPTVGDFGDVSLPAGALVSGAVWDRRVRTVVGGQGEVFNVTAEGFFPADTDLRVRDRITLNGRVLEVVQVISGYDDRGRADHVGALLSEAS